MRDNPEVFRNNDVKNIINKIRSKIDEENGDEFLVRMLSVIDPKGINYATANDI